MVDRDGEPDDGPRRRSPSTVPVTPARTPVVGLTGLFDRGPAARSNRLSSPVLSVAGASGSRARASTTCIFRHSIPGLRPRARGHPVNRVPASANADGRSPPAPDRSPWAADPPATVSAMVSVEPSPSRSTGPSASPTTSSTTSCASSAASPTTSSWPCTPSCGASTAPTSPSRVHLRRLPTEGARVLVGPGENAGVIDAGGGIAVAMRIESHNHPSAIEPYQGAATGVGGILRDIFTMGARPIAVMDPLRFGPLDDARSALDRSTAWSRASPATATPSGVPTVGGEIVFDACYADNPLVNVLCCGVLPVDRLVLGAAYRRRQPRRPPRLARPGGTASAASACWPRPASRDDAGRRGAKRPNVQVGDPFEEKRLIEACLELLDERLVVGIQDLGGAGLTCATSETASRGRVGMDVDVTAVPRREPGMEPWEVMTSESQERMLAIVTPDASTGGGRRSAADGRCGPRWSAGSPSRRGRLRIRDGLGWRPVLADVPAATLHEDAPLYRPPPGAAPADLDAAGRPTTPARRPGVPATGLRRRPAAPCWSTRPGSTASTTTSCSSTPWSPRAATPPCCAWPAPGSCPTRCRRGAVALSTDGNARWCALDPRAGTALVVAEAALNLACVGRPPGRPRQLPQLRQPRAPRGHVAAVGGDRRHGRGLPGARHPGHRRQRQPLQREPGRRHRPDPGRRHARPGRRAARAGRPASAWRPAATPWCCSAPGAGGARRRGHHPGGSRWAVELPRPPGRRAARRSTWRHAGCLPGGWWPRPSSPADDAAGDGIHDVSDGRPRRGPGRDGRGRPASGALVQVRRARPRRAVRGGPSRVLLSVPDGVLGPRRGSGCRSPAAGSAGAWAVGGGDRLVVEGLLDLSLGGGPRPPGRAPLPAALGTGGRRRTGGGQPWHACRAAKEPAASAPGVRR